jgi:O-antigen/teichoic acid export membrane protein
MSEKSLKEKALKGFAWSSFDKTLQQVIIIVCGILLARRLFDYDYGLIGTLSIFTYMANALQEGGFTSALIRKKNANESDYNTVFYTNIFVAVVLYVVLFFSASFLSSFYEEPVLKNLSRFIFLSFVFNALGMVQYAQIVKKIDYKSLAKVNLFSTILSYGLALFLAYSGYGPWAVATLFVATSGFKTLFLWIFNKWKPNLIFSKASLFELFAFSSKILMSSILNAITNNIIPSIVGKYYSISQTGYYTQANRWFNSASEVLIGSISNVTYPVLVEGESRLKKITRKIIRIIVFITFPSFLLLALVAKPFIICLLGEKWMGSAPILQILCLGGVFYALSLVMGHVFKVKGMSNLILRFEIIKNILILTIITLCVLMRANYLYMIGGLSFVFFVTFILQFAVCRKLIEYKYTELIKDIFPYFVIAIIAVGLGYLLVFIIENQWVLLFSQVFIIVATYLFIAWLSGSVLIKEIIQIIKTRKLNAA